MRIAAVLAIIVCGCAIAYILWGNIAVFFRKKLWRECLVILAILAIGVAAFLIRSELPVEPTAVWQTVYVEQRLASKDSFYKYFLSHGYEVTIQIRGNKMEILDISCPSFTHDNVQGFKEQGVVARMASRLGFNKIDFRDSSGWWIDSIVP